jgi:elongation factor P
MYSAADLRKGLKVEIDENPYEITEFNFVKPGKGQSLYVCKLKNMLTGSTLARTFRANDKVEQPALEEKNVVYSYAEGSDSVFMDRNFEQISVPNEVLGRNRHFLVEEQEANILFYNDRAIEVRIPTFVEKVITETEPGARGNTATNVMKPAKIESGYELNVPLFVNQGDLVRIDTRTGEYVDRARKS